MPPPKKKTSTHPGWMKQVFNLEKMKTLSYNLLFSNTPYYLTLVSVILVVIEIVFNLVIIEKVKRITFSAE